MLVETCSSIGQELTRSSKSMETALGTDSRKRQNSSSPNHKPTTPRSSGSSPSAHHTMVHRPVTKTSAAAVPAPNSSLYTNNQLASLAQYQLMYQQLLYQAEIELLRAQQQKSLAASSKPDIPAMKQLCPMCALTPGYTGHCIHDELTSNPALLAMLNSSMLYNKLTDPSALSAFNHTYLTNKAAQEKESSMSPPAAHSDKRRRSPYSPASHRSTEDALKPMDLHVPSPPQPKPQLKECHWTDSLGYCGKRFISQDDLMEHIKVHVLSSGPNNEVSKKLMPSPPLPKPSFEGVKRFQPYSLNERSILSLRH